MNKNLKNFLRQEIITKRQALSEAEVAVKSDNIHKHLLRLPQYEKAGLIMVYVDFNNEVRTGEIITTALNKGKRVAVPVCRREGWQLIPSEVYQFPADLAPGTWGILEPKPGLLRTLEPREIDLILVPGVAFDRGGNRLGYGAGYYDRFLAGPAETAATIALAFELQVMEDVFPAEHDFPVQFIVTEDRVIDCQQK